MALVRAKARILERTITAGNGPYALAGPVDGSYKTFASFMSVGDTTFATVVEPGVAFWTGIVTYSAANQITLTTVEETSGTFGSGTKEIFTGASAAFSMFPQDIAGAIVTGGTSAAYTVASYRKYDTLTRLNGNLIAFTPHTSNGQTVTLNVDGLGAKPLRAVSGVELGSNVLIQGTPYLALYNHSDQVFYLHAMGGNTYGVPLGGLIDHTGSTAPSSAFVIPRGQAISRTTYAAYFALVGTAYGSGDGSTTFNVIDLSGRTTAMVELSATRLTSTYFGGNSTVLGTPGGADHTGNTIAQGNLPSVNLTANNKTATFFFRNSVLGNATGAAASVTDDVRASNPGGYASVGVEVGGQTVPLGGSGTALQVGSVMPTAMVTKLLRVL
jgi:microcystin-dependent protein